MEVLRLEWMLLRGVLRVWDLVVGAPARIMRDRWEHIGALMVYRRSDTRIIRMRMDMDMDILTDMRIQMDVMDIITNIIMDITSTRKHLQLLPFLRRRM